MKVAAVRSALVQPDLTRTPLDAWCTRMRTAHGRSAPWPAFVPWAAAHLEESYRAAGASHAHLHAVLVETLLSPAGKGTPLFKLQQRFGVTGGAIKNYEHTVMSQLQAMAVTLSMSLPPSLAQTPLQALLVQMRLDKAQLEQLDLHGLVRTLRAQLATQQQHPNEDVRRAGSVQERFLETYLLSTDRPSVHGLADTLRISYQDARLQLRALERRVWVALGSPPVSHVLLFHGPPQTTVQRLDAHRAWPADVVARRVALLEQRYRRDPSGHKLLEVLRQRIAPSEDRATPRDVLGGQIDSTVVAVQTMERTVVVALRSLALEESWPLAFRKSPLGRTLAKQLPLLPQDRQYALQQRGSAVPHALVSNLRARLEAEQARLPGRSQRPDVQRRLAQEAEARQVVLEQQLLAEAPVPDDILQKQLGPRGLQTAKEGLRRLLHAALRELSDVQPFTN